MPQLSDRAGEILQKLRDKQGEFGGRMSRSQLGMVLGRGGNKLTSKDYSALTELELHKLIEIEEQKDNRPNGKIFFYRA